MPPQATAPVYFHCHANGLVNGNRVERLTVVSSGIHRALGEILCVPPAAHFLQWLNGVIIQAIYAISHLYLCRICVRHRLLFLYKLFQIDWLKCSIVPMSKDGRFKISYFGSYSENNYFYCIAQKYTLFLKDILKNIMFFFFFSVFQHIVNEKPTNQMTFSWSCLRHLRRILHHVEGVSQPHLSPRHHGWVQLLYNDNILSKSCFTQFH